VDRKIKLLYYAAYGNHLLFINGKAMRNYSLSRIYKNLFEGSSVKSDDDTGWNSK